LAVAQLQHQYIGIDNVLMLFQISELLELEPLSFEVRKVAVKFWSISRRCTGLGQTEEDNQPARACVWLLYFAPRR